MSKGFGSIGGGELGEGTLDPDESGGGESSFNMALGAAIKLTRYRGDVVDGRINLQGYVAPVSLASAWQTIIDPGGVATQDAATITNPDSQIDNDTTHPFETDGIGTYLLLRLGYDDALTSITNPVLRVFGRSSSSDIWMPLPLRDNSGLNVTLTTGADDTTDGTLKYTTPNFDSRCVDLLGCSQVLVGVQTALAGTGSTANAIVQIKII